MKKLFLLYLVTGIGQVALATSPCAGNTASYIPSHLTSYEAVVYGELTVSPEECWDALDLEFEVNRQKDKCTNDWLGSFAEEDGDPEYASDWPSLSCSITQKLICCREEVSSVSLTLPTQSTTVNTCVGPITVKADEPVWEDTIIELGSDSILGGAWYVGNCNGLPVSETSIPKDETEPQDQLYFMPIIAGTDTLTARDKDHNWTEGSSELEVQ